MKMHLTIHIDGTTNDEKKLEKSAPSATLKIRVQNGIQFESLGSETSREKTQINYSESKAKPGEAIEIFRKKICTKHY